MTTLVLRLAGPMQSWGTSSRFDERDTGKEPSKSGVIGLLAAALGIDREDGAALEPLSRLLMGVRHDRPGVFRSDYQTAQNIVSADRSKVHPTAVTTRQYLADAVFLVGLEGENTDLLARVHEALCSPVWPLFLGRKSYTPSESVWLPGGLRENQSLREAMQAWPWLGGLPDQEASPERLLFSWESAQGEGVMKMDQPLSSFASRRFGARFIRSEWLRLSPGVAS